MDLNAHSSDKIEPNKGKSLRFELELTSLSEETKEFSYAQLVSGISEGNNETTCLDPLVDNEEAKLAKIAKRFEEKYGPSKRKRLIHESDLIDRGYGYDPSDSFVDDSELYEDYVPPQLDTKCGGFYINTGVLEFKTLEDAEDEELNFVLKRKLVTKKHTTHGHTANAAGSLAKQKLKLAIQKAHKNTSAVKCQQRAPPQPAIPKQTISKNKNSGEKKLSKKQLLYSSEPRAACIPVGVGDISVSVPLFKASSSVNGEGLNSGETTLPELLPLGQEQESNKSPPVLPSNLPVEIQSKISSLEESILKEQHGGDGKLSNKIRAGYDEQLVDIELACKKISVKERTVVFEYLSSKVGISRQTILKRVKLILRKREGGALETPLLKLKEAVADSMVEQLAQYEEDVKNRTDLSIAGDKLEQEEDSKMDDIFEDTVPGVSQTGEGNKPKRLPRKRYKWTENVKKLLCDVVRLKVTSEEVVNRIRVPNGEELITQFLEDKVRPLWPKGWMQKGVLYKMSESAHKHFTSPQLKKGILTSSVKSAPLSAPLSASFSTPLTPSLSTPPLSTHLSSSLSTPLTPSLSTPLTPSLSTPLTPTLSTPLTPSLSTSLTPSLSTPLTPLHTTPLLISPSPSTSLMSLSAPLSTAYPIPSHVTLPANTSIKKALTKMEDGAVTTPTSRLLSAAKHVSPLGHHSFLSGQPAQAASKQGSPLATPLPQGTTPAKPAISQLGSSHGKPAISQLGSSHGKPAIPQLGSSHGKPAIPQLGSSHGKPAISQLGSSLSHDKVHDSAIQQSPAASVGNGQTSTPIPSNGFGTQTPVQQTLKRSNKTTSAVGPVAIAMLEPSLLSQLQQVASMASRHQHIIPSVNSGCVASVTTQVSGGVPFSLNSVLQSGNIMSSHATRPSQTPVTVEMSLGNSNQRLLTLSRNPARQITSAVGRMPGGEQTTSLLTVAPMPPHTDTDRKNQVVNALSPGGSSLSPGGPPAPVSQIISEHSYGVGNTDK